MGVYGYCFLLTHPVYLRIHFYSVESYSFKSPVTCLFVCFQLKADLHFNSFGRRRARLPSAHVL